MQARDVLVRLGILALLATACQGSGDVAPSDAPSSPGDGSPLAVDEVTDCPGLATVLVDELQRYVDSFSGVTAEGITEAASALQVELSQAASAIRERADELDCDTDTMAPLIRTELDRLEGGNPVQDAIAATFRSDPLGRFSPADRPAATLVVSNTEELETALATAGSGSTLQLAGGTFELDRPLVVLRPVTIEGADAGGTTLRSSAAGAAIVLATDGDTRLTDVTIAHVGDEPASVLVVSSGGYELDGVRIEGARADDTGGGGFGAVLRPQATLLPAGSSQSVRDSVFRDNETGGIVVAGQQAPTIADIEVSGSSGCGVCWLESGAGTLTDATVRGTETGLRIEGQAAPTIVRATVEDAETGVAVLGTADPELRDSTLTGNTTGISVTGSGSPAIGANEIVDSAEVGVRLAGTSTAALEDNQVTGDGPAGIAVTEQAEPEISGGEVAVAGEVGILWGDEAAGTASDVTVTGPRVGVQVGDDAAPTLTGLRIEDAGDVALFATGGSSGSLRDVRCDDTDSAIVALLEDTTVDVAGLDGCRLADERGNAD